MQSAGWTARIRWYARALPRVVLSRAVGRWRAALCTLATLNLVLWVLCAVATLRGRAVIPAGAETACRVQLLLSAAYVLGCAYRSVLPVYDIPRLVLLDSRLSSVVVGRSVATVAELCFAIQWALLLHGAAWTSHAPLVHAAAIAIVPLITLAEGCSWHAVLTTAQRGHIVENSLWGLSAALVVASLLTIGPHRLAHLYPPMLAWCAMGTAYAVFIFLFDVPIYWSRWRADRANRRAYLSIAEGLIDASRRRVVSYRWQDWKDEVAWMSLYFSFGAWSSISLVYASLALGMHGG